MENDEFSDTSSEDLGDVGEDRDGENLTDDDENGSEGKHVPM